MKKLITILFLLIFCASQAHVNIYVATNGNDDTGDSSIGNPYLTIQKGADIATAGDAVIVRDGAYTATADPLGIIHSGIANRQKQFIFQSLQHWDRQLVLTVYLTISCMLHKQ